MLWFYHILHRSHLLQYASPLRRIFLAELQWRFIRTGFCLWTFESLPQSISRNIVLLLLQGR